MPASNLEGVRPTTRAAKLYYCAQEPLRYLTRIGFWGDERSWLRRYLPALALGQAVYGLVAQVINVAQTWGKLALAAEYCVALLQILMTCVKIRCLLANTGKIQMMVTTLGNMHSTLTNSDEVREIRRHTRATSERFARVMHILCSIATVTFSVCISATFYNHREIPFRRWYPYDIKPSPIFELTVIIFNILTSCDYYIIALFDLLVLCILIEVVGEFRVLQHCLKIIDQPEITNLKKPEAVTLYKHGQKALNLSGDFRSLDDSKLPHFTGVNGLKSIRLRRQADLKARLQQERFFRASSLCETTEQRLARCVIQHHALIRFVSKLEGVFQSALVINVVCNFCVGLTIVYVTLKSEQLTLIAINMLVIGFVCIGEFALYCYFCTQITTESTLVGEALYSCCWWEASASFKKSMRIVQLRTNRPLIIRAAAIFPMSMKTFTKVMDTAYKMYGMMVTTN